MQLAVPALGLRVHRLARAAAVQVLEALLQLVRQLGEAADGVAGLAQLVREDLAHGAHRLGGGGALFPHAQERLDLGQREAHVLQLLDPLEPRHRARRVQPEAPLGPHRGRQQPQLLVEVNRARGLAGPASELADLQQREAVRRDMHGLEPLRLRESNRRPPEGSQAQCGRANPRGPQTKYRNCPETWYDCGVLLGRMGGYLGGSLLAASTVACATPSLGRGGPVYEVIIESVDERPTALRGPAGYPACTVQVGDHTARVWLAAGDPALSGADMPISPPILKADAAALEAGILLESSWTAAIVHEVTKEELAAEAATVHVPYPGGYHVVELRFRRVPLPGAVVTHDSVGTPAATRAE